MPADLTFRIMNAVHRGSMAVSRGRLGWTVAGMPALELTTNGRKSGRPRTVWLTSPVQEGPAWVIVASRGGDDHAPAWFLNLRDDPDVLVSRRGQPAVPMRARIATPEERDRLWPLVIAKYQGYAAYQKRTSREIPLVLLEPA